MALGLVLLGTGLESNHEQSLALEATVLEPMSARPQLFSEADIYDPNDLRRYFGQAKAQNASAGLGTSPNFAIYQSCHGLSSKYTPHSIYRTLWHASSRMQSELCCTKNVSTVPLLIATDSKFSPITPRHITMSVHVVTARTKQQI